MPRFLSRRFASWVILAGASAALVVACSSSDDGDEGAGEPSDDGDANTTEAEGGANPRDGSSANDAAGSHDATVKDAAHGDGAVGDGGADGSTGDASTEDASADDASTDASADASNDGGDAGDRGDGGDAGNDGGTCGTTEICDGVVDDDCDGVVDDGCGRCPLMQTACPTGCCAVDRWQIDTSSSDNGSSIAVDAAGNIYFAYTLPSAGAWSSVLAVYDAVPGTWRKVQLGGGTYRNRVRLDADGHVHVVYGTYSGNYALSYVRSDDGAHTFSAPTVIGNLSIGGVFDMALDSQGHPHVAYNGPAGPGGALAKLFYTSFDGTNWSKENLDTGTVSPDEPELALGFLDRPHIAVTAYHPDGADSTTKRHIFYNGNRWIYENVDTRGANASYASGYFTGHSLQMFADGSTELLFMRTTAGTPELVLAHRGPGDADTWSSATLTGVSNFAEPTMFLDHHAKRAAVSAGIGVHRESAADTWTSTVVGAGVPGTKVAEARRGRYVYLGYTDPTNANRPTVTVVDLGP